MNNFIKFWFLSLLILIKCADSLRSFSYITNRPFIGVNYIPFRKKYDKLNEFKDPLNNSKILKEFKGFHVFSTVLVDNPSPNMNEDFFDCPSIDEFLNKRFLFSDELVDLESYDHVSREIDYRKHSQETTKNMKRFIAIALSTLAVGALYKFATFLKGMIEEQIRNLV